MEFQGLLEGTGMLKRHGNFDTQNSFIAKAVKKHGNTYGYSKIHYQDCRTKLCIICKLHGEFWQTPVTHLSGRGCPKCGNERKRLSRRKPKDTFVAEAEKVHQNQYDYSESLYVNDKTKLCIICKLHGKFWQTPHNHIAMQQNCPKCSLEETSKNKTLTQEEFIDRAITQHGKKYDYSLLEYRGSKEKLLIVCPQHGRFFQKANNHLTGQGCPKCSKIQSTPEQEILDELKRVAPELSVVQNSREIIPPKELDMYFPQHRLAIEYCGLYWHREMQPEKSKYHLQEKLNLCLDKGIRLITVFENEWLEHPEIVKSRILNALKLLPTHYARNLHLVYDAKSRVREFLEVSHIQGICPAQHTIHLEDANQQILAAATFGKSRYSKRHEWEFLRYATKPGGNVVGGVSRIFSAFLKIHQPLSIVSYADRRWGEGNVYTKLGFRFSHSSAPNYFYFKSKTLYSRIPFQKHKLAKKLPHFNVAETEAMNMFKNGYNRIYDCGNNVYIWEQ